MTPTNGKEECMLSNVCAACCGWSAEGMGNGFIVHPRPAHVVIGRKTLHVPSRPFPLRRAYLCVRPLPCSLFSAAR